MKVTKIVITGGPCAGKTTALERIKDVFTQKGYHTLFIAETATELISGGVAPWTLDTNKDYQLCQIRLQCEKEKVYDMATEKMSGCDNIIIVCDRGIMDNKAYMNDEDFSSIIKSLNLTEEKILAEYDAVFHLVTAAKGAAEFYTCANNSARRETIEQATELDDKLINSWKKHPCFKIIENPGSFDEKMENLICAISEVV